MAQEHCGGRMNRLAPRSAGTAAGFPNVSGSDPTPGAIPPLTAPKRPGGERGLLPCRTSTCPISPRVLSAAANSALPEVPVCYPLVKELAADGSPVAVRFRALKLVRQPYYRRLADPVTDAEYLKTQRANALFDAPIKAV